MHDCREPARAGPHPGEGSIIDLSPLGMRQERPFLRANGRGPQHWRHGQRTESCPRRSRRRRRPPRRDRRGGGRTPHGSDAGPEHPAGGRPGVPEGRARRRLPGRREAALVDIRLHPLGRLVRHRATVGTHRAPGRRRRQWAVRHLGNRTGGQRNDARSVRRFFQYLLLFGLLIVAAVGLSELLGLPFQEAALAGDDRSALARALTFTVFGIPMFLLLAASSRRHLQRDPDEAASVGWAVYLTVAPLTALVVAMFALYDVVWPLLSGETFDGPAAARLVVWGAVWLVHWTVAN